MRALRVDGPGAASLHEVSEPAAGPGSVVVAVRAAAICPTDRKIVTRGTPLDRTLGHEAAGVLPDGTAVGVHPDTGCGECEWCRVGWTNRCASKVSIGIDVDGGIADAVAVPERHAVPLGDVPMAIAPLLEPFACAVHAVSVARIDAGASCVVIGAGAMGIFVMWALQAAGAHVTVVQRSEQRRVQARELGADAVAAPGDLEDLAATAVFVTAGGAEPLDLALRSVAVGGIVHAFAGTPGGAFVDANLVHYRQLTLYGTTGSGLVDYRHAIDLQSAGGVDLSMLPVGRLRLSDAPDAVSHPAPTSKLRTLIDIQEDRP